MLAFAGEGELDQERVARRRLLAGRVVPPEREPGRRLDGLDDDRAALLAEAHVAVGAGLDLQVHLVGEPLGDLVGLGDGAPHHLDGGLDQDLPLDLVLGRAHGDDLPVDVQPKVARQSDQCATISCRCDRLPVQQRRGRGWRRGGAPTPRSRSPQAATDRERLRRRVARLHRVGGGDRPSCSSVRSPITSLTRGHAVGASEHLVERRAGLEVVGHPLDLAPSRENGRPRAS